MAVAKFTGVYFTTTIALSVAVVVSHCSRWSGCEDAAVPNADTIDYVSAILTRLASIMWHEFVLPPYPGTAGRI